MSLDAMQNLKLLAVRLGDSLKNVTTRNELERIGSSVFPFARTEHPHSAITSSRAQIVYDWVMTVAEQQMSDEQKEDLLRSFVNNLVPPGHSARDLLRNGGNGGAPNLKPSGWQLLHPRIQTVAESRFDSRHFADAVEAALKDVNNRVKAFVKNKTGEELDGAPLMNRAFSAKSPVIVLDDLTTESGKNIQLGYMQIFAGSMTGIRNPKAHANISISPERATQFLILASLLMEKLDEAKCP